VGVGHAAGRVTRRPARNLGYLEWIGSEFGGAAPSASRKDRLTAAMRAIRATERGLAQQALTALTAIPGLRMRGIVDPDRIDDRVPTFAFTLEGASPHHVASELGKQGIATWDGDYYAYELIRALGLGETGGMVRVGFVHYNDPVEIERLALALREISGPTSAPKPNRS
jgi:selenocysteine lyase/cysteine desulfurase